MYNKQKHAFGGKFDQNIPFLHFTSLPFFDINIFFQYKTICVYKENVVNHLFDVYARQKNRTFAMHLI